MKTAIVRKENLSKYVISMVVFSFCSGVLPTPILYSSPFRNYLHTPCATFANLLQLFHCGLDIFHSMDCKKNTVGQRPLSAVFMMS